MQNDEPDTLANCDEATLASFFRMLDKYQAEIVQAEQCVQTLMGQLQIEAGKTFKYQGQWYQICKRRSSDMFFFKELKCAPAKWLNKKAREDRDESSESEADFHEPDQLVDVIGESGALDLSDLLSNQTYVLVG